MKLQMTGLRLEEVDAQKALAGLMVVDPRTGKPPVGNNNAIASDAAQWVNEAVGAVLNNNQTLTREWEERNPGVKPFHDLFVEVVLRKIHEMDPENPMELINELKDLAEKEMNFG